MTFLSFRPGSSFLIFVGDLGVDVLKNGELDGVMRIGFILAQEVASCGTTVSVESAS